ncbi:MAG TPA: HAD-IB family hydrolase [Mycobacteriales bacterium]|nr:HAD-IB family hydrolase [Mycobacteriales bacterium]
MGIRSGLANKRLLLTGTTGFVGEALLERILSELPDTRVVLVVRPQGRKSARARVEEQLRTKSAFAGLRTRLGDDALVALLDSHVDVIEGDLGAPLPALPSDLDVVIHCAGEVTFDMAIDEAFRANLLGAQSLLDAVRASGSTPHWLHVSTAYVAGLTSGWVPEARHAHEVDWRAECAAGLALRDRVDLDSRVPGVLGPLLDEARAAQGRAGSKGVADEAERLRKRWVHKRLVEAGLQRAQSLGWTDAYTFTKALTERMTEELCADWGVPLTVVRPTIVESALTTPHPGWIEGFKVAEPIILAYGRGQLPDFPAAPDTAMDIVPVDILVAAMLAAAATPPAVDAPAYYQVGSSARNPLRFLQLYTSVRHYFQQHPMPKRERGTAGVPTWQFASEASIERKLQLAERGQRWAEKAVGALPQSDRSRSLVNKVDAQASGLRQVRKLADLYRAYTQAEVVYTDDNVVALLRSLPEAEQRDFPFDVAVIDWHHYLTELHCPAVTAGLRWLDAIPMPAPKPLPELAARPAATDDGQVIAAFDLDGTLVKSTVVEAYLWTRLADLGGRDRVREVGAVLASLPGWIRSDRVNRSALLRSLYLRYAGADLLELERLVDDDIAGVVLQRVSAAALRRVREHRAAGHRTVLVTGALDVLTRPLAPLFDEIAAVHLITDAHGIATGRLAEPPLVGEARGAWLRRRAGVAGWDLSASYAYADSHSDLPMLRAVGHPVAVNPDADLLRIAKRGSWPVETWPVSKAIPAIQLPERTASVWG